MNDGPVIVWFRQDLRLTDNPALTLAQETGREVIPLYILDDETPHAPGAASRWWLHHSLTALDTALAKAGARLLLRRGRTTEIFNELIEITGASQVLWNRRYTAGHVEIDKRLKQRLTKAGINTETFNGALLREPWEIETKTGGPYQVFTPFWKALRAKGPARLKPFPQIRTLNAAASQPAGDKLADWTLFPQNPNWAKEFETVWTPGENGALKTLDDFLTHAIDHYRDGRDRPDRECTSRLSPHLAFGEIGPVQIWHATRSRIEANTIDERDGEKFLSEIAWREFSYSLLYYNPELPEKPLHPAFKNYPWRKDTAAFDAWRRGETGYPIVDAGMRQLWRTGWMHNRVRMITASFLIKDLLISWQKGEAWFWDTLVDANLANNSASWQWVAGCGADASPFFRIFNPVTQGEKFDPHGDYIREFVPELAALPAKYIHAPWKAPQEVLEKAAITLGKTYKNPIINHAVARKRALTGYEKVKGS